MIEAKSNRGKEVSRRKRSGSIVQTIIRSRTILFVDGELFIQRARRIIFEALGYCVLTVTSGEEALASLRSNIVDAVVLDYQMPGMNADTVAAKMKSINSHVPIMLLSAYGPLPKNKLRSVDSFLSKSQPPNILLSTLRGLLDDQHKPFFSRWLDQWKNRNQVKP